MTTAVPDRTPPTPPTLSDPPDSALINVSTPVLSWTYAATEPGQSDVVEVSTDSTFPGGSTASYPATLGGPLVLPAPLAEGVETYWRVMTTDAAGNQSTSEFFQVTYLNYICGDVDGSGATPDVSDLTFLVA